MAATLPSETELTDVEVLISKILGVTPELVDDYDLVQLDADKRLQVRIDRNTAPREMVERFVYQMGMSKFPPIVVTLDHRIVDGNTRYKAHRAREERYVRALVIPISWDESDPAQRNRLLFLGSALNNSGPKPLDKSERREMVRYGVRMDMTTRELSQWVGVSQPTVDNIKREIRTEDRLNEVGFAADQVKDFADSTKRNLGKAVELHDEPFRELAKLAHDAGLNGEEVSNLGTTLREQRSDELALERIARERETSAQRIADRKAGKSTNPPAAAKLRQALGIILHQPIEAMVERNPDKLADHLEQLQHGIAALNQVLELQTEVK